jgi:hypothetical protein
MLHTERLLHHTQTKIDRPRMRGYMKDLELVVRREDLKVPHLSCDHLRVAKRKTVMWNKTLQDHQGPLEEDHITLVTH